MQERGERGNGESMLEPLPGVVTISLHEESISAIKQLSVHRSENSK